MELISAPIDFVGLNLYQPTYVRPDVGERGYAIVPTPATFPRMNSDWLSVGPEIMYWVPRFVAKTRAVKSIFITENGAPGDDGIDPYGQIYDIDRIMFLRSYLAMLETAIAEGVPVGGYFVWSLLDNFEWDKGYTTRFGIYGVDRRSQKRTPKASARFLKTYIRANTLRLAP